MSKTYFNHTSKLEITKAGIVPACTIAISRKGNEFIYGVSICSRSDNFSRKTGREIAEDRMINGFASMEVPKTFKSLNEKDSCLEQLYNLTVSLVTKNKKWKRKVTSFNKKVEEHLKLVLENRDNGQGKIVTMRSNFGETYNQPTPTNRA